MEEPVIEEAPEAIEELAIEEAPEAIEEPVFEEVPEAIEEPVIEEIPEAIEEPVIEEIPEAIEEPVFEEVPEAIEEPVIEEAPEVVDEPEIEEYEEVVEPVEEQPAAIGLFEDIGSASEEDEEYEEEEYEDITPTQDDKPVKKKSGKGLAVAAAIFIICVICAGAYALKDYIPVVAPTDGTSENESTVASTEETTEEESTEETTEEETTEEETSEETTEPEETTTEEAVTTEPSSENEVVPTTKPTTTKPTTTKPTTTRPTTTRPTTTKPTTTRPTTTRPTTTKPTTTKPGTTKDPYGINDVEVKKPSNYVKSYTGYVTAEGLNMRAKPTTSSDRVLYLSKGADVKVLAKENGFLYVYSNRYGVSGWVSAAYISTSRPTETTSKLYTGTVQPDVKTAAKTMHTTYSLNIRKGPSTSYPSVQIIATGYPVKVLGSKSGVSGWVYVTDLTYGISGWVSTAYLK
ncbi:MAG: SH3 domain-containing protein [Clostridia bacterium]|nr:SH3 domain-containing protein [Clostridia bacterium]